MSRSEPNRGEFDAFRDDIEEAERRIAGEIEPGARALVVAILVFVLIGSFVLPHTGDVRGWDVLFSTRGSGAAAIALPSRARPLIRAVWLSLRPSPVATSSSTVRPIWLRFSSNAICSCNTTSRS